VAYSWEGWSRNGRVQYPDIDRKGGRLIRYGGDRRKIAVSLPLARRPLSPARRRQRDERRASILEAADRLIARDGLSGLSMRLLAKEVGIPAPTLYGYFDSKEAVIDALAQEKIALLSEAILREAKDVLPGVPRLLAFARGYRTFALSGRDYYDLFILKATPDGQDAPTVDNTAGMELIQTLAEDVQTAIDLGQLRPIDPEQTILALWAVAHGYVSLEVSGALDDLDSSAISRERTFLLYFESMLRGLEVCAPTHPASGQ
jgi:AcrR family transcriptional regulator